MKAARTEQLAEPTALKLKAVTQTYRAQPNIHIDRMRIFAPCTHTPLGKVLYFEEKELAELLAGGATERMLALKEGGPKAYVRSKDINARGDKAYWLEIHCCPPLVLQKHNLFGHGVLQDYAYVILDLMTKKLGIAVDRFDRDEWQRGGVRLTEIHLTGNFPCPQSAILDIIQAIDDNNPAGKSRPYPSSITLGYAKNRRSTYHMLTIYAKALEMMAQSDWKKPDQYQAKLLNEAQNTIRAEVKLYSQELKRLKLDSVMHWNDIDVAALFFKFFDKYRINYSIQRPLTDDELDMLTKAERRAYLLWLEGHDIEQHYSRTTAWKYAKTIRDKTGIDIKGKRRPDKLPDIDLREVFCRDNLMPVPDWAVGTEHYFAPGQIDFIRPRTRPGGIAWVPVDPNAVDQWVFAYGEWRLI